MSWFSAEMQAKEIIIAHELPDKLWEGFRADIFSVYNNSYIVLWVTATSF